MVKLKRFGAVFFMFLLAFLPTITLAQIGSNFPEFPFQTWWNPDALATILGNPAEWQSIPKVIYYVFVPFLVAVTVVYGILTEIRIFRKYNAWKINLILSVAMAFLLLPSGILTTIVSYFYAAGTFIGLVGFGVLFIFGTIMWVYGTGHRIWGEQVPDAILKRREARRKMNEINKRLEELENGIAAAAGDSGKVAHLQERKTQLETERAKLRKEIIGLETSSL